MANQVAADLRAAADLLETRGWTQHANARDARGLPVPPRSPLAVCYCLNGAIGAVIPRDEYERDRAAVRAMNRAVGTGSEDFVIWNDLDHQTAENVIATIRRVADEVEAGK